MLEFDIGSILSNAVEKTVKDVLNKGVDSIGDSITGFISDKLDKPLSEPVKIGEKPKELSDKSRKAIEAAASIKVVRNLEKEGKIGKEEAEELAQGVYRSLGVTEQEVQKVNKKIGELQETFNQDLSLLLVENDEQFLLEFDLGDALAKAGSKFIDDLSNKAVKWGSKKISSALDSDEKEGEGKAAGEKSEKTSPEDAGKDMKITDKLKG